MEKDFRNKIILYFILIIVGFFNLVIAIKNMSKGLMIMWIILIIAIIALTIINFTKYNKEE
ncbi:hypothetical protein [Miniphocaeibacter massiliensis]|uniref:hypothetical protein n=1 Tax=Miniphocaeibacter massiliensis TaxID=2041841 RepID=UPI000C1C8229|nr:hypothetical protein [Miniphocaeibacter massiliensis]